MKFSRIILSCCKNYLLIRDNNETMYLIKQVLISRSKTLQRSKWFCMMIFLQRIQEILSVMSIIILVFFHNISNMKRHY